MESFVKIKDLANEIIETVLYSNKLKEAIFKSIDYLEDSEDPDAQFDNYADMEIEINETIGDVSRKMIEIILQPHFNEIDERIDEENLTDISNK